MFCLGLGDICAIGWGMKGLGMRSRFLVLVPAAAVAGCAHGAPTLSMFGSYVPIWLLCGILGSLTAIAARVALIVSGLSPAIPAQLLFCCTIGVIAACLLWLWLGQ